MAENHPKNVLIADHGAEDELGDRPDTPRLSEILINALGRLAISEALGDEPPGRSPVQTNQVHVNGSYRATMGKPLELVTGRFYFLARCPATGSILDAIVDDTAGTGAPLTGEWSVACADCDTVHAIDMSTIRPERFVATRRAMDQM